jgi:hypothetical protein
MSTIMPAPERRLAAFTLAFLAFYAPIETWGSWPDLLSPYYLVDLVGILLLLFGAVRTRRGRSRQGLAFVGGGWAWMAAAGWRATADRVFELAEGGQLEYGNLEMCFVVCSLGLALAGFVWSLAIASRSGERPQAMTSP